MKLGDKIHRLVSRDFSYFLFLPAPYNLRQCEEHLSQLTPDVRAGLDIVTLEVVAVQPASTRDERAARDTEPSPALTEAEFHGALEAE